VNKVLLDWIGCLLRAVYVRVLRIVLHYVIGFVLSEAGVVTTAFWDRELTRLAQSANLSLACTVIGVDQFDVIRVVHSYGAKTLLLADNDVLGAAFSQLPRYRISYSYGDNRALVTVHING